MKELLDTLTTWGEDGTAGDAVGRAVVVRTFGSAPRPEGAVLLYATDGRIAGSVSGGCVEGAAAEEIDRARATGHARVIRYGISDEEAWDVGLACGGTIDVLVEPVAPAVVIDGGPGFRGRRRARFGGHHAAPRGFAAGRVRSAPAGRRRAPGGRAGRRGRRRPDRDARHARAGRRAGRGGRRRPSSAASRGPSTSAAARCSSRSSRSGRGSSSSAASRSPGRSCASRASSASRPWSSTAAPRSRRPSASPTSIASSSAGRTRSPTRSGSGRTTRSRSCRTTSSSTSRPSSRPSGAAVATSAPSARRRPRPIVARASARPVSATTTSRACADPSGLDLGGRAPAETALAILAEIVAERYGGSGTPMRERALALASCLRPTRRGD